MRKFKNAQIGKILDNFPLNLGRKCMDGLLNAELMGKLIMGRPSWSHYHPPTLALRARVEYANNAQLFTMLLLGQLSLGASCRYGFLISVAKFVAYYDACATLPQEEVMRGRTNLEHTRMSDLSYNLLFFQNKGNCIQ